MSASNATVTPTNIVLTPMRVTFNGVDLGGTEGGVSVNIKYDLADMLVDQFGKTPVDAAVSGEIITVKLMLAESKNVANWKVAFPSSKNVQSGTAEYFDMQIGDRLLARASALVLHPLSLVDSDLSGDLKFYKAVAEEASEVKYGPEKQVGLQVTFKIFPDTSTVPAKLMILGDPSTSITNASAGSVTPGSNTGTGTLVSVGVSNQYTKTETITITVVGASSGNNLYVSGSVSGALGEFHIAAASGSTTSFTSNPINFVAEQLTTQFATNDSFTIATTAANYT